MTIEFESSLQLLKQSIADKKPLVDRLTKTGNALLKLVGEEEGDQVQAIMDGDTERYDRIKNSIREQANNLDEALQQTSEVRYRIYPIISIKIQNMLEI